MILRAIAVWWVLLLAAVANGGARDAWLSPRFGDPVGRAVSTVTLCVLILLITWATILWIRPAAAGAALRVGALWLALTLAFEFLAAHYALDKPWPDLLGDYDLRRGRIWMLVLMVTLLAPLWAARIRGLPKPGG